MTTPTAPADDITLPARPLLAAPGDVPVEVDTLIQTLDYMAKGYALCRDEGKEWLRAPTHHDPFMRCSLRDGDIPVRTNGFMTGYVRELSRWAGEISTRYDDEGSVTERLTPSGVEWAEAAVQVWPTLFADLADQNWLAFKELRSGGQPKRIRHD